MREREGLKLCSRDSVSMVKSEDVKGGDLISVSKVSEVSIHLFECDGV